ncbi:phosphoribosyltransferase [Luteitalea sp. TBR-22]|uniref:phosphoribosyltransferase n=1 Tax=Luteitalea sp. TBR-22 TaxID=2802971 RepID=UPI001AF35809|nr:phosphoribosyltransferase family protein [Luteitalea sp. TBR-22]BCS32574.1 phosphoribosyltransferase [Luteitalea sp. TBR-22]
MHFLNRSEAAHLLATRLFPYRGQHPLVLGVPRGAVPMARVLADALDGDLDVVLVRKLRAPGQPELAIGAVDEHGTVLCDSGLVRAGEAHVREEIRRQTEVLRQKRELYSGVRGPIDRAGRIVIIVDDGIATGSSMVAAVRAVRARAPRQVIVAVAVAPPSALLRVRAEADEVVCLHPARDLMAVGQFFDDFSEVTDAMVLDALARPLVHTDPTRRVATQRAGA